jgi:hypothetical protein
MSALVGLVTCWVVAAGMVIVLHLGDWRVAIVYALMIVGWLVEETGRRVLIARLEFWKLVANDGTYMATTLVALGAVLVASRLTLLSLLACMAFGALCAIALALVQLPRGEFTELAPGPDRGARVARFAVWRSMQATLRPAELLVARVLVLQLVSLTAVGLVEAGRLVVAPIQTVLNGAAAFLLSTGAHGEKSKKSTYAQNTRVAIFLVVITLGAAAFAALLSHPLGHLMARRSVSHLLVLGWGLWMATWAASLPFTAELTVRTLSRPVFVARLVETCVGLGLVAILLGAGASAELVPWLLSAPAVVNTWYIRHLAVTTRPPVRLSTLQPAAAP